MMLYTSEYVVKAQQHPGLNWKTEKSQEKMRKYDHRQLKFSKSKTNTTTMYAQNFALGIRYLGIVLAFLSAISAIN